MMKKYLIFIIVILMLLSCFGCSSSQYESIMNHDISGVFQSTIIPIPEGYGVFDPCIFNDGFFTANLFLVDSDGTYYNDYNRKNITFDTSGSSISIIDVKETDNNLNWTFSDAQFSVDDNFLLTYSYEGNTIAKFDLPTIFNYDFNELMKYKNSLESSFSIIKIEYNSNDTYYILTTEGLCSISIEGKLKWVQTDLIFPIDIIATGHGLFYIYEENKEKVVWLINSDNGSLENKIDMPLCITDGGGIGGSNAAVSFYSCDTEDSIYDFYAATNYALWGINISISNKKNIVCDAVECVNWINSDISPDSISNLCIANEETLTLVQKSKIGNQLILLKKVLDSEISSKSVISLASLSESGMINPILMNAIKEFNISNSDYRIVITDFTIYDIDSRDTIFNAEIASGNIPDIVILSTSNEDDNSVNKYVKSGIFCDLNPLMKNNSSFDQDNLLGYIKKPYLIEGKQYVFPLKPTASTQFGSSKFFSGPLTIEETLDEIKKLPEGSYWTSSSIAFKRDTLQSIVNDFVDINKGCCSFDSPLFVRVFKELFEIPDNLRISGIKMQNEYFPLISDGKLRLLTYNPVSLYDYVCFSHYIDGEAVAVGYPNKEKNIYIQNAPNVFFAISEESKNKDVSFDLLNYIYDAFETSNYNEGNYAFFKNDIYRQMNKYLNKTLVYENGAIHIYNDENVLDSQKNTFKITNQDAEKYISFLNSIDAILPTDSPVYKIVSEEFYGYKTKNIEKIVDIIQSRASIYIAEQYQ